MRGFSGFWDCAFGPAGDCAGTPRPPAKEALTARFGTTCCPRSERLSRIALAAGDAGLGRFAEQHTGEVQSNDGTLTCAPPFMADW
jgi:hypothetical protein